MNMKNFLELLKEELKGIQPVVKNVHYTSLEYLFNILRVGLRGNYYDIKANKNEKAELCTVRAHKSDKGVEALSLNVGGIKIHLYTDRILAAHRGTKLKQIAEYPIYYNKYIKEYERTYKDLTGKNLEDEDIIKSGKKINSSIAYDYLKEKYPNLSYEKREDLSIVLQDWGRYKKKQKDAILKRETEERFILSDNIPVKPEFMKIEIIKLHANEYNSLCRNEEGRKADLELLQKYNDVFVDNENYRKLKELIARTIKKRT